MLISKQYKTSNHGKHLCDVWMSVSNEDNIWFVFCFQFKV